MIACVTQRNNYSPRIHTDGRHIVKELVVTTLCKINIAVLFSCEIAYILKYDDDDEEITIFAVFDTSLLQRKLKRVRDCESVCINCDANEVIVIHRVII